jgi:hypothetical protein
METQPGSGQEQTSSEAANRAENQSGAQPGGKSTGQDLMDELTRLGNKFVQVVDVAWNSDQRRRIEDDLRKGLQSLATSLEDGLKKVGESDQTKEFIGTAEEVAESVSSKVRSSKVANDLAVTLARGLHSLGDHMDRLAKDMQSKQPPPPSAGDAGTGADSTQDIPISRE